MRRINLSLKTLIFVISMGLMSLTMAQNETAYEKEYLAAGRVYKELFENGKWDELEAQLETALKTQETIFRAQRKLHFIGWKVTVDGIYGDDPEEAEYDQYYKKLQQWQKAHPNSIFTPALEVKYWTSYAWAARGSGYAHTVNEKGWKLFKGRLEKANDIFQACVEDVEFYPNPLLYLLAGDIALGLGWGGTKNYEVLCKPVIEHFPWYDHTLRYNTLIYEPKWGGKKWDRWNYYHQVAGDLPKRYSDLYYAKLMLFNFAAAHSYFDKKTANLSKVKAGALKLIEMTPNYPFFLEQGVRFFDKHGEKGDALAFYKEVQKNFPDILEKHEKSSKYLWLFISSQKEPETIQRLYNYRPSGIHRHNRRIRDMAYIHKYDLLVSCTNWEGIRVLNKETGNTIAMKSAPDEMMHIKLAVSSDGKYLAALSKNSGWSKSTLSVYEISSSSLKLISELSVEMSVRKIVFSSVNEKIFFATKNGVDQTNQLCSWNWKEGQKTKTLLSHKSTDGLTQLSIRKEAQELIYSNGNKVYSYDLSDAEAKPIAYKGTFPGAGYWLTGELFDNGRYYAALPWMKNRKKKGRKKGKTKPTQLYIFDTQTRELISSVPIEASPHFIKPFFFNIQATAEKNKWKLITGAAAGALSTWELKKSKRFEMSPLGFTMHGGYERWSSFVRDGDDPASEIYIGNYAGLIGVWKFTD